jgi:transcriptional regulator with XRE-family HTH domain
MLLGGRALRIPLLGEQHEDQYNRFIRDRVREAREERAMTQETLGEFTYKSRVAISDLERGRTEITAAGLLHIAVVLEKPITFFFADLLAFRGATAEELSDKEKELIHFYRQIANDAMEHFALNQVKQLAKASIEADQEATMREVARFRLQSEGLPK